ncbi:uncharacterized protein LOC122459441 [Dermochelys coriacea]|uniref:uncharacterized protein LOC122459441 n=1 Tax=Dermochelys coriacea TaxID=27794 RepID=UPI001CA8D340|nr:uncharacterized protein LOC122459441 [Dermochelys coriacea]
MAYCFYKELDMILGGNPTSMLSTSMDTSEANATRQEEEEEQQQSRGKGVPAEEDTPETLDACGQELLSSQEEGSQSRWQVFGEGQNTREGSRSNLEISAVRVFNGREAQPPPPPPASPPPGRGTPQSRPAAFRRSGGGGGPSCRRRGREKREARGGRVSAGAAPVLSWNRSGSASLPSPPSLRSQIKIVSHNMAAAAKHRESCPEC